MNRAESLLLDLVSTPSISGNERTAAEVFVRHAKSFGLDTEIDEAGNALAHRGPANAAVHIVLLGHIDTVPGEIPVRIESGVLHGRGSVDAKGPLAAMLVAAATADVPENVRVSVAGAVGEETPHSPGARHLANQYRPSACIIGEPSRWDGVTLGYKGRLVARALCELGCAHSAGPDASACDRVLAWWNAVMYEAHAFNTGRARVFDQIQASLRSMASQSDGLVQSATLEAGFRLPLGVEPGELESKLVELAPGAVQLSFLGAEVAVASDRNDPVVRALTSAIRAAGGQPRPKLKTGTSDFNVVAPIWRCPIAAYGPGDSALDHTPGECLSLDEYERSIDVLRRTVHTLALELLGVPRHEPAQANR